MTDTIQSRIREYLAGENDECPRKLLREAADGLDALSDEVTLLSFAATGLPPTPEQLLYRAPSDAWPKR